MPPVVVSGRTEHHADLHADLVDEDDHAVRLGDRSGQLAQRLAHQAGLEAGQAVAHLAFDFGARRQRCDRIDDQHIDGAGAHQRVGDFERLLAGIRLRDQQIFEIDAELAGIDRIERMLGIDEGADAALLLGFGDGLQRQRRLARAFRPIDLDDAPAGRPPMPSAISRLSEPVETVSISTMLSFPAELHDRALAEGERSIWESAASKCLAFIHRFVLYKPQRVLCHVIHL